MPQKYDDSLHMMEVLGGSFVKALAHCYVVADNNNRAKLHAVFSEYFDRYEKMFQAQKKQATPEQPTKEPNQ